MHASEVKSSGGLSDSTPGVDDLIATARTGSNSALGRALNACRPRLLRMARKSVGNQLRPRVGASDVVQDAFINATKGFGNFRGQRSGEFVSWLCTILANRLAEIARRAGRASGHLQDDCDEATHAFVRLRGDDEPSPSSIAGDQEHSQLIRAAVARMSPRDQQVLRLRFDDQLTFQKIGEKLALSEDAARMLFARALKRLKCELHVPV